MQGGSKSCLIEFWGPPASSNGEPNPAPSLFKSVWARVYPLRGRERENDTGRQGIVTYRAELDWYDGQGIDETMQARFEGGRYDIKAVLDDPSTHSRIDLDLQKTGTGN